MILDFIFHGGPIETSSQAKRHKPSLLFTSLKIHAPLTVLNFFILLKHRNPFSSISSKVLNFIHCHPHHPRSPSMSTTMLTALSVILSTSTPKRITNRQSHIGLTMTQSLTSHLDGLVRIKRRITLDKVSDGNCTICGRELARVNS